MSYTVFCTQVVARCAKLDRNCILFSNGEQLKVCYSHSEKYERYQSIQGSTRIIGHYDKKSDPDSMAEDIRDFFSRRDQTKKSWEDGIDASLTPVVDNLLQNLHQVSGNRLAALKVALRDFNIQKQRWYERSGS